MQQFSPRKRNTSSGYSLIEVLLGITLLSVMFLTVTGNVLQGKSLSRYVSESNELDNLASSVVCALNMASCDDMERLSHGDRYTKTFLDKFDIHPPSNFNNIIIDAKLKMEMLFEATVTITHTNAKMNVKKQTLIVCDNQ